MNIAKKLFNRRSAAATLAIAGVLVAVPVTAALAAGASDTYTGCVNTAKGTISKVKLGTAPLTACVTGETQVSVSGGDITAVLPGAGLTGGASTGNATLSLAPSYALPQGCATGKTPKRSTTGWFCGTDFGSLGTKTATFSVDANGANSACDGADNPLFPPYIPGGWDEKATGQLTLALGTYQPSLAGNSRWYVNRTADRDAAGALEVRIQQTLNGVVSVVSTWARAESSDLTGAGLPYNQDFSPFVALPGATYSVVFHAGAAKCSRARLLDGSVAFTPVG